MKLLLLPVTSVALLWWELWDQPTHTIWWQQWDLGFYAKIYSHTIIIWWQPAAVILGFYAQISTH